MELKIPPPIVAMICALLMWVIARGSPALDFFPPRYWQLGIALFLLVVGMGVGFAAVISFRRHRTTVNPMDPEATRVLVTSGVFRFSRNPMYLGVLLMLAALAIGLANFAALLMLGVFVAFVQIFQIMPEERVLQARFGSEFTDYCLSARRWI